MDCWSQHASVYKMEKKRYMSLLLNTKGTVGVNMGPVLFCHDPFIKYKGLNLIMPQV